jgi:hypothetical protein
MPDDVFALSLEQRDKTIQQQNLLFFR